MDDGLIAGAPDREQVDVAITVMAADRLAFLIIGPSGISAATFVDYSGKCILAQGIFISVSDTANLVIGCINLGDFCESSVAITVLSFCSVCKVGLFQAEAVDMKVQGTAPAVDGFFKCASVVIAQLDNVSIRELNALQPSSGTIVFPAIPCVH
ncbi:hypothetical protein XcodCFBP4690_00320 [Xanthomonas codiaei]|uniref:Uncharacterized protein n=1 Tax=Xanthomonas codiaei TaxID=56463 RepID=A0A2S7CYH0_9XANT|nr:hypothetical protein XcodCFBP4690_00320 [Xanthomonas codiaei]